MNELEKLYNVLTEKGYYTKSFEEFQDQYSDDSYKKKVYDVVSKDELYTNDYDSFVNKYTSGVKKKRRFCFSSGRYGFYTKGGFIGYTRRGITC